MDGRASRRGVTDGGQRGFGLTEMVALEISPAVTGDGQIQGFRQGIHDGDTNPVEPPRNLVGFSFGGIGELSAGMKDRHDDFRS